MELSIAKLIEWLERRKSQEHEELKARLIELKSKRNYLNILNKDLCIRNKYDREIKRLEKKLNRGIR